MPPVTPTRAPNVHPGCINVPARSREGFEELCHLVTEADPDTALCGVDQTGVPWNQGLPVCQACLAVAEGRLS